jgi:hypothetical protein
VPILISCRPSMDLLIIFINHPLSVAFHEPTHEQVLVQCAEKGVE